MWPAPLRFGARPASWGTVVRSLQPDAAGMSSEQLLEAAGLAWRVDQWPLEAITGDPDTVGPCRVAVSGYVANVRADTGRAHWLGAGSTRGGARVFALMRLDSEIRIGGASGEDMLPLLMLRNGHDGGLAVTVSVTPFRLACLNGMLLQAVAACVDHTQPVRRSARRTAQEARFERATEPSQLKDRALELLTEA